MVVKLPTSYAMLLRAERDERCPEAEAAFQEEFGRLLFRQSVAQSTCAGEPVTGPSPTVHFFGETSSRWCDEGPVSPFLSQRAAAAELGISPRTIRAAAGLDAVRSAGCSLSLAEAARRYRKSTHTLRAAIQAGELRAHRVSARRYDVFPADVDAWIRSGRVETARERARRAVAERC